MQQAKFADGKSIGTVQDWMVSHNSDYAHVRDRLETVRNVLMHGRLDAAERLLKRSYVFAVLSIQTERDRHERAFTAHYAGDKPLKEASLQTVYGGQKYGWMSKTLESTEWDVLAIAVRSHAKAERYPELLEVITDNLVGVAYRKGAFMLAMAGLYEFMCVDSNVGRYAGIDKLDEFDSAHEYMDTCREIWDGIGAHPTVPPFIVQWAIYDFERGHHSTHRPYFREVLDGW